MPANQPIPKEPRDLSRSAHDLATACSTQTEYSNRVWLALIASAMLGLFPDADAATGNIKLPFSLGVVDGLTYKIVGFSILLVLTITFCHAYVGTNLASRFAHEQIDTLPTKAEQDEVHRLFNFLVAPNFSRVFLLADPIEPKWLSAIYYLSLKFIATIVIFVTPSTALLISFIQFTGDQFIPLWMYICLLIGLLTSMTVLAQTVYLEAGYAFDVVKKILDIQSPTTRRILDASR